MLVFILISRGDVCAYLLILCSLPRVQGDSSYHDASAESVHDRGDDHEMAEEGRGNVCCGGRLTANSKLIIVLKSSTMLISTPGIRPCLSRRASRNARRHGKDLGMFSF